ncbi:uncharacterized protein [Dysidea avara]|uniref:uncharacterized protein isoform X2 n=1 Tax=Dysidea avara TaxID=196820 RepID=UPI0033195F60
MKRSSSAPMISEIAEAGSRSHSGNQSRVYGLSSSLTIDTGLGSTTRPLLSSPGRLSSPTQPRVWQLKVESSTDEGKKEIIHEREVKNSLILNHYLDGCNLGESSSETMDVCLTPPATGQVTQFFMSPSSPCMLSVSASAASVRSRSLTPTSPSPTRRSSFSSGSASPIHRPSSLSLGQKRKRDTQDAEDMDTMESSSKKHACVGLLSPVNSGGSSCSSPIAATSPLHHSFSLTSHQRSSISSTSSSSSNPFTLSAGPTVADTESNVKDTTMHRLSPSIYISDASKVCDTDNSPTPLSPRGIKFHQKSTFLSALPSPVPKPKATVSELPFSSTCSSLSTASQSVTHNKLSPFHSKLSISSRRKFKHRSSFTIPNPLSISSPDAGTSGFIPLEQRNSDYEDSSDGSNVEQFPHSPLTHSQQADEQPYTSRDANITSSPLMHNSSFSNI